MLHFGQMNTDLVSARHNSKMRHFVFITLLAASELFAQDQSPVFYASSELVLVDVQVVRTKTGAPAPALQASDFRVFEEGVPQKILHFSRDEFPLSVVLLFDLTDSVRPMLQRLAEGAETALENLQSNDEVAVMVYAVHASVVDGFTTDRTRTVEAIERAATMKFNEPAYFNEAVYRAARKLGQNSSPSNRRVMIWLTDNIPNTPEAKGNAIHSEADAFRALHEESVVVAPILLRSPLWAAVAPMVRAAQATKGKSLAPGDAHKYAELTGGEAVGLRGKQPEERLAKLIEELHARYTVGYRPSDAQAAGTFRKIRVELVHSQNLRPREWIVLARQGYYGK